jgi:elongation factor Ts
MEITAQLVKELRDRTGVGMGDCKSALVETNGDIETAIELLRKKGIAKASKRAENATKEGRIAINIDGNKSYMALISCETDFVSRSDVFAELVKAVMTALQAGNMDAIETLRTDAIQKLGENIRISTDIVEGAVFGKYVHTNEKVGAIVVGNAGADVEKLRDTAMHATATAPQALSVEDFPADVIAKEKDIALEQMKQDPKNEGKPQEILEKIVVGKLRKFAEENALLSQPFVKNPEISVEAHVGKGMVKMFKRYSIM